MNPSAEPDQGPRRGVAVSAVALLVLVPLLAPGTHAVILALLLFPAFVGAVLLAAAASGSLVPWERQGAEAALAKVLLFVSVLAAGWLSFATVRECVGLAVETFRRSDWSTGTDAGLPMHPGPVAMLGAGLRLWWAALGVAGLGWSGLHLARIRLRGMPAMWLAVMALMLPFAVLATSLADRSGFMAWTA